MTLLQISSSRNQDQHRRSSHRTRGQFSRPRSTPTPVPCFYHGCQNHCRCFSQLRLMDSLPPGHIDINEGRDVKVLHWDAEQFSLLIQLVMPRCGWACCTLPSPIASRACFQAKTSAQDRVSIFFVMCVVVWYAGGRIVMLTFGIM